MPDLNETAEPNLKPYEPSTEQKAAEDTVICMAVFNDTKLTGLMRTFDVFEPGKAFFQIARMTLTHPDRVQRAKALELIREGYDQQPGDFKLIAIFIPQEPEGAWWDSSVKTISNGTDWTPFWPWLLKQGYAGPEKEKHSGKESGEEAHAAAEGPGAGAADA